MKSKKIIETTTLNATMAVSKIEETGMNHVQVLPDDMCAGLVEPFRGLGYGQMISTGTFEFTQHRIPRSQAERLFKLPHLTCSKCKDRTHRLTFIVPDWDLENFCRYLMEEIPKALTFMHEYLER